MSDDHSELEPPLPIPNRAVKRLSADDSADYPCESRTSSGTHETEKPGLERARAFLFVVAGRKAYPRNIPVRVQVSWSARYSAPHACSPRRSRSSTRLRSR